MKNVVVFAGNDCLKERESYFYSLAFNTGKVLAKAGFTVVSGGGPGLMDETMRGAFQNGGKTIAVCLEIPGRNITEYATEKLIFQVLTERQDKLISYGDAFIALPGGVGTLYEIFEILALKRKMEILDNKPLILVGPYYDDLEVFLQKMITEGFITDSLNKYCLRTKTPQEALEILKKFK